MDQNLFRGLWRGSGSSGFFGLSRLFGSTNERDKTVRASLPAFSIGLPNILALTVK
jgi:hypothetical protein